MTRFKDFGSGGNDNVEPLSFKLYDEEFHCVKQVQGKILMELVAESDSRDAASSMNIVNKFYKNVLLDESFERFEALLEDKERIVTVDTLGEITGWLVEEYTKRPNQEPEDS